MQRDSPTAIGCLMGRRPATGITGQRATDMPPIRAVSTPSVYHADVARRYDSLAVTRVEWNFPPPSVALSDRSLDMNHVALVMSLNKRFDRKVIKGGRGSFASRASGACLLRTTRRQKSPRFPSPLEVLRIGMVPGRRFRVRLGRSRFSQRRVGGAFAG